MVLAHVLYTYHQVVIVSSHILVQMCKQMRFLRMYSYAPGLNSRNVPLTIREQFECFIQYWHSRRDKWLRCVHQIEKKIYGNFTNNKVESQNEKIKQYMSRNMHLPDALRNLLNSIMDSYNRSAYSIFFKYQNKN